MKSAIVQTRGSEAKEKQIALSFAEIDQLEQIASDVIVQGHEIFEYAQARIDYTARERS